MGCHLNVTMLWAPAVLLLAQGCSKATQEVPAGAAVARWGSEVVTVSEVEARLHDQIRTPDLARARENIVNEIITTDMLAAEARHRHLDQEPKVQAAVKKVLAAEMRRVLEQEHGDVSDSDIRSYFEAHLSEFERPERVRVDQIRFECQPTAGGQPDCREATRRAQETLAELQENERRQSPKHPQHAKFVGGLFAQLASPGAQDLDHRPPGHEVPLLTRQELTDRASATVADGAFALAHPGDMSPVIEANGAVYILRLLHREPGHVASADNPQTRSTIRATLLAQRRSTAVDELLESQKKKDKVEIDEKLLATITPPAPSLTPATKSLPPSLRPGQAQAVAATSP